MLARISALLALIASLVVAFVPLASYEEVTVGTGGEELVSSGRTTLLEDEGWAIAFLLAAPAVVAFLAVALERTSFAGAAHIAAAAILLGFAALGAASIGLFYAPSALVMTAAAALAPARSRNMGCARRTRL
jgi:hypothetical protein